MIPLKQRTPKYYYVFKELLEKPFGERMYFPNTSTASFHYIYHQLKKYVSNHNSNLILMRSNSKEKGYCVWLKRNEILKGLAAARNDISSLPQNIVLKKKY